MVDFFHGETDDECIIDDYDRMNYHLCICQNNNGKYKVYVDIEGMKGFIWQLHFAALNRHSYGEGDITSHESKNAHFPGHLYNGLIFSIIGRKYSKSPSKQSYEKVNGKYIELYLKVNEAKQLLERALIYYAKIVKKGNAGCLEIFPGLTLEYIADW